MDQVSLLKPSPKLRPGRSSDLDQDALRQLVECNPFCDSHFFVFSKMLWMTKIFLRWGKRFVENFFSLKLGEFYSRGINTQPDTRQEMIQNNCEYTIDWN